MRYMVFCLLVLSQIAFTTAAADDSDTNSFWKDFRAAIITKDKGKLIDKINFPVLLDFGGNEPSKVSREIFIREEKSDDVSTLSFVLFGDDLSKSAKKVSKILPVKKPKYPEWFPSKIKQSQVYKAELEGSLYNWTQLFFTELDGKMKLFAVIAAHADI